MEEKPAEQSNTSFQSCLFVVMYVKIGSAVFTVFLIAVLEANSTELVRQQRKLRFQLSFSRKVKRVTTD